MAMQLSILGAQPLLPLADEFTASAEQAEQLGGRLDAIGGSLGDTRADVAIIGVELETLSRELESLRGDVWRTFSTPATLASSSGSTARAVSTWKTVAAEDHVSQRVGLVDRDQLPVGDERDAVAVLRLRHVLSGSRSVRPWSRRLRSSPQIDWRRIGSIWCEVTGGAGHAAATGIASSHRWRGVSTPRAHPRSVAVLTGTLTSMLSTTEAMATFLYG